MDQVQTLLSKLYRQVGSSKAKRFSDLLARGEWALLQQQRMSDPKTYRYPTAFHKDVLITEITRKLLLPGDTISRREAAVRNFWASEAQCHAANLRLSRYANKGPFEGPHDIAVDDFISRWRKELKRVLGAAPWALTPRFPPGSTLTHRGKLITIPDKMQAASSVYSHSERFVSPYFIGTLIGTEAPSVVRANRFFTVPKDSQKDRGCCMEASRNVMLQLDVGRALKARYKRRYSVDLRDAPELHRELAQAASMDGSLATIDLSNASDTVCKALVDLLLPPNWRELLNSLRATHTEIDGRMVRLEKFSSMGNGFTFELETILFRSLAVVITDDHPGCSVFGDDIIVPTQYARAMIAALRFFGFTPNEEKTFCDGPFRESCGGDFFQGHPVRGYYMKELPDEPQKWIGVANGLRRADPTLRWVKSAWRYAVDQVPKQFRHFGPHGLGDLVIWDPDAKPKPRLFRGTCSGGVDWEVELDAWTTVQPVTRKLPLEAYWSPEVVLAAASYGVGPEVSYRGNTEGIRVKHVPAYGVADPTPFLGCEPREEALVDCEVDEAV